MIVISRLQVYIIKPIFSFQNLILIGFPMWEAWAKFSQFHPLLTFLFNYMTTGLIDFFLLELSFKTLCPCKDFKKYIIKCSHVHTVWNVGLKDLLSVSVQKRKTRSHSKSEMLSIQSSPSRQLFIDTVTVWANISKVFPIEETWISGLQILSYFLLQRENAGQWSKILHRGH